MIDVTLYNTMLLILVHQSPLNNDKLLLNLNNRIVDVLLPIL